MPLSWNEIRTNAVAFSKEFEGETREHAEAKTFWDRFFQVFGLNRRHLASFEEPVKKLSGKYGFIDLFWKGMLLVEHKSAGKDLDRATSQAFDYIQSLVRDGRQDEAPRYVLISDFSQFVLFDLEDEQAVEFLLKDLVTNVEKFGFIPGYKQNSIASQDPINLRAVEIMGTLHDSLEAGGYEGHELERLLVRILFCLFAEDTGIFERNAFTLYLENHTKPDGSDLGAELSIFFDTLNRPVDKRQKNLREELAQLPYVNGEIFAEFLGFPAFDRVMRDRLLKATRFDWSRISPAVFGALFQAVMQPAERREIGAHYTSERDILKVIEPLFLDELKLTLEKAGRNRTKLTKLHDHIASMKFLDPACGCGNFLVITYRELRLIELEILKRLNKDQTSLDSSTWSKVDVDQMYGIEIEEWPARIAEVALWLMDHQMNLLFSEAFGQYLVRLPLKKSPHICHTNALTTDWNLVLQAKKCSFVFGNPPFIGSKFQSKSQRAELRAVFGSAVQGAGLLDYVTAWYILAARYIQKSDIAVGFVSTNSISQGEQVGVLWYELSKLGVEICFAHRTFAWRSEARGAAHVHVVIVGFSTKKSASKALFEYASLLAEPTETPAKNISPYLIDAPNIIITNRSSPLCNVPAMISGNKPIDDGNYLFEPAEMQEFIAKEPAARKFFFRWLGGREFIQNTLRYCLYLEGAEPSELRRMPLVMERIENVARFRSKSASLPTKKIASTPTSFHTKFKSTSRYLALPQVSSERRKYIPIAFLTGDVLCGDKLRLIPDASLFLFGGLCSAIHMAWVRVVSGRLKSDFQYSAKLVYNNFPWPQSVTDRQRAAVEAAAEAVLDARGLYPNASLADLYDPIAMPAELTKAHAQLDREVDRCYRSQPFTNERMRVEFLFSMYEKLNAPLVAASRNGVRKAK